MDPGINGNSSLDNLNMAVSLNTTQQLTGLNLSDTAVRFNLKIIKYNGIYKYGNICNRELTDDGIIHHRWLKVINCAIITL